MVRFPTKGDVGVEDQKFQKRLGRVPGKHVVGALERSSTSFWIAWVPCVVPFALAGVLFIHLKMWVIRVKVENQVQKAL